MNLLVGLSSASSRKYEIYYYFIGMLILDGPNSMKRDQAFSRLLQCLEHESLVSFVPVGVN